MLQRIAASTVFIKRSVKKKINHNLTSKARETYCVFRRGHFASRKGQHHKGTLSKLRTTNEYGHIINRHYLWWQCIMGDKNMFSNSDLTIWADNNLFRRGQKWVTNERINKNLQYLGQESLLWTKTCQIYNPYNYML